MRGGFDAWSRSVTNSTTCCRIARFDLSTTHPVKSNLRHSGREVGSLGSRSDDRNIAYKVPGTGLDLWPIFGTVTLVAFLLAFATIVWQPRHTAGPTSRQTPTDRILLIASP